MKKVKKTEREKGKTISVQNKIIKNILDSIIVLFWIPLLL
jgi:hypothetical protein